METVSLLFLLEDRHFIAQTGAQTERENEALLIIENADASLNRSIMDIRADIPALISMVA